VHQVLRRKVIFSQVQIEYDQYIKINKIIILNIKLILIKIGQNYNTIEKKLSTIWAVKTY